VSPSITLSTYTLSKLDSLSGSTFKSSFMSDGEMARSPMLIAIINITMIVIIDNNFLNILTLFLEFFNSCSTYNIP